MYFVCHLVNKSNLKINLNLKIKNYRFSSRNRDIAWMKRNPANEKLCKKASANERLCKKIVWSPDDSQARQEM